MRIVYIADDGREFDNGFECEKYEFLKNNPCEKVLIYNKNKKLGHPSEEESYENGTKIIIPDEKSYKEFHKISRYFGWCEWEDEISSAGDWRRLNTNATSKQHWYNVGEMDKKEIEKLKRIVQKR